jgi:hypothetical protein
MYFILKARVKLTHLAAHLFLQHTGSLKHNPWFSTKEHNDARWGKFTKLVAVNTEGENKTCCRLNSANHFIY